MLQVPLKGLNGEQQHTQSIQLKLAYTKGLLQTMHIDHRCPQSVAQMPSAATFAAAIFTDDQIHLAVPYQDDAALS